MSGAGFRAGLGNGGELISGRVGLFKVLAPGDKFISRPRVDFPAQIAVNPRPSATYMSKPARTQKWYLIGASTALVPLAARVEIHRLLHSLGSSPEGRRR